MKSAEYKGNMKYRIILLCIVAVSGGASQQNKFYKTQIGGYSDSRADIDGKSLSSILGGAPYVLSSGETTSFAEPVHFISSYNSDGSKENAYKIFKTLNPTLEEQAADLAPKATEVFREHDVGYGAEIPKRSFRHSFNPSKNKHYGKSSYPSVKGSKRRSDPSAMEYYTDLYSKQKDVEMILPKEKSIILPMVNGKPKPYQGYRAASDIVHYEDRDEEVIYGKPKKGVDSIPPYRIKRSPAEYHGGIYPHFDYSDPENAGRISKDKQSDRTDKSLHQKNKKGYPKKHTYDYSGKPYDYYKYPKGNRRTNKRSSDESEEQTEEDEEEQVEEEHQVPPYKYKYDSSFIIPELEIKYYPYEKQHKKQRDNKEASSEDEETYESQIDEYTAGYEQYKKTLPTDLESYFGRPDFGDYSVEATENLENNKNCEKITRQDESAENATEEANEKGVEVCYICRDPKTGGNYEQCAYKTNPKSEKYFYGGSSSSKSDDSPEPINYRYKRSTFGEGFDLDSFIFGKDHSGRRKVRQNIEESYFDNPRQSQRRKKKNWQPESERRQERYPSYGSYKREDHYGSPSSRRNKKSKNKEGPPDSYDGPKYTYEGPRHTYEGPAETYEGPISKEYYITSDDRIENDEGSQSNEESQSKPQEYYGYNAYHPPDRRYSQSSNRKKYTPEPQRDVEELEENFGSGQGYTADYRFGPEHFVDDEEVEEERPKEKQKSESKPKPVEKKQKHSGSESRQSASTGAETKEPGSVKVFKNGDVCRKKKVDGMICMVCRNEKTAATYEQCQYSSKPKDKYYAFGSQKSYRTSDPNAERPNKNEEEDQHPEKSDVIEKKILITKQSKVFQDNSGPLENLPNVATLQGDLLGAPSDNLETQLYGPRNNDTGDRQISESIIRIEPRDGIEGLEEYLYSDVDDNDKKASDEDREYRSYDEYFHDIFPEFSNRKENEESRESEEEDEAEESEESESERHVNFDPFSNIRKFKDDSPAFLEAYSVDEDEEDSPGRAEATNEEPLRLKDRKSRVPPDFFLEDSEDYHKKDIEKALGEFQSRDWSNCKKIVKNKLTCYQCVDKNGVNNEECMYVEASQPMKKHLAYHERKELKPEGQESTKETNTVAETVQTEIPATEKPKTPKRIRRPKNSKEVSERVTEQIQTKQKAKGDFEGVRPVPEDVMTPVPSVTTETVYEDSTEKIQIQNKWNPKRIKTSKKTVESTTEKLRKRKHPLKINDDGSEVADATENKKGRSTERTHSNDSNVDILGIMEELK